MPILSTYRKVVNFFKKTPGASVRAAAAELEMSKSSVHRQQQAQERRQQYPESYLWDSQEGYDFLCRLVIASLYHFGFEKGIGADSLSRFFHALHIQSHIAVSPSKLRDFLARMEDQTLEFEDDCQERVKNLDVIPQIVAGADETFFERMILVLMDLSSGFIFMEVFSAKRTYDQWMSLLRPHLLAWPVEIKQVVSDQAKALIKLAADGFECLHVPDLFHATQEVVKAMGLSFAQQLKQAGDEIDPLRESIQTLNKEITWLPSQHYTQAFQPRQTILCGVLKKYRLIEEGQNHYRQLLLDLSKQVHPFSVDDSAMQSSAQVLSALQQTLQALKDLKNRFGIPDASDRLGKCERQLEAIAAGIDFWWAWVDASLLGESLNAEADEWVRTVLLPWLYWQAQRARTDHADLRRLYQRLAQQAHDAFNAHDYTQQLGANDLTQWRQWAQERVKTFQRASSAVEGRNGYLAQVYHTRRGLSDKRLKVLTIIHNFGLKRPDGTTAAQRLYRIEFPDLLEHLIQSADPLPASRRSKKGARVIS